MAAPIGPGDWVICINAGHVPGQEGRGWGPGEAITEGALYQVAACFISVRGRPCVDLVGKDRSRVSRLYGYHVGYHVSRFRPLLDGSEGLTETLLEPIREDTRQPEHA